MNHRVRPAANLHHLHRRLHVVTVRVVHQVRKCRKRMVQRLPRRYPALLVDREHPLQQVDKLPPVRLLRKQLATLDVRRDVHLPDVVQAVEDVLASLLAFVVRLRFVLLGRFEPPEGVRRVHVPVEELGRLAGTVEHVLGREALRLRYVPLEGERGLV